MIPIPAAQLISELFYDLDANVRQDLYHGRIADERDYVSRMVTHFNYPFGIFNKYIVNRIKFQSKWFARVNSGREEQKFGCDSMIIFKVDDNVKIGLFEAKWPRVIKNPKHLWDYNQKTTKTSHFTDQIKRQGNWTKQAAIWEMFFYEEMPRTRSATFDTNGSSCIRHHFAQALVSKTPSLQNLWDNNDLTTLIKSAQTTNYNGSNETNIKEIVFDILTCRFGQAINIGHADTSFTLTANDNEDRVRVPIITVIDDNNDGNQVVEGFMAENGLSFFQQLNIEPFANQ